MRFNAFLIFIFLFASESFARKSDIYRQIENALLKDQFSLAADLFDEYEEDYVLDKDEKALILKARALEGQKEYKDAIDIYIKLIKTRYSSLTKKIAKRVFKFKKRTKLPITNNLRVIYFKLSQLYTHLYLETHQEVEVKKRDGLYKKAIAYIRMARSIEEDTEAIDELRDKVSEKKQYFESIKFKKEIYFFSSFIMWQDIVETYDEADATRIPLLNSSKGTCLGAGMSWINTKMEYYFDACYISATSTVSSSLPSFNVSQAKVPVTGYFGGPGFYYRTLAKNVSLGLQLVVLFREGDWDPPTSTATVDDDPLFGTGVSLNTKWDFGLFGLTGRFSRVFKTKSSTFSLMGALKF